MKITRRFTKEGQDVYSLFTWSKRTSRISNPDGSVVFEMTDAEIPSQWSQLATDIMVSKYFRKAGIPLLDENGNPKRDEAGKPLTTGEKSARQVIHRLAGCWRHWGETHGYFDTAADAQTFYDEIAYMMLDQACAPNSPQWFNTGLHHAYGITGPAQGHFYCDPRTGELKQSSNAYEHPQPHACFIQSVADDLVNPGGIMDLWTREARLFKYGSGTGSNFSNVRGENERLSGGGRSSGLMSFLKIGDRAAGAIKSGGTTRRAAKMCCLDLDHPDIEDFVNWKVREELKVAALVEGLKVLPQDQKDLAKKLGLKLDYDFNGESYMTVSGQNSNNSIRIPNAFFEALDKDGDWTLTNRVNKKAAKTVKARKLWDEICFAAWRCADPGVQYDTTINQWHTCPASGRINASNPCVTGDTRVLTPGGIWRRIDQMIHLPARIVTNIDGKEIHVVEGSFPTGTKDVYELKTACGFALKLTADHKVWTRNRGWVEAQHLTKDDELRLMSEPACVEEVGEPVDGKLFQMAGFLLSSANDSLECLKLESVLGMSDRVDGFIGYAAETWGSHEHSEGNTLTKNLTNRRLLSRINAFIKVERDITTGACVVRLSDDTFTAGLAAQKHLLRGLFTADGVVDSSGVVLTHTSLGLLQDVQLILMGFGIQSKIESPSRCDEVADPTRAARSRNLETSEGGAFARGGLASHREGSAFTNDRAVSRHGLRIDEASLRSFGTHIAFLSEGKLAALAEVIEQHDSEIGNRKQAVGNYDRIVSFTHLGKQQVFDLTEPVTSSFVANGITVHNCSEYMFLDDTACNLASLNVMRFFDAEKKSFDIEGFRHGIRLWTIVLEISVLMASFPSEDIAKLSYKFRTLGLGYANLGALLMQAGIPYDSEKGRAFCGAVTAILTGESYATSAEMSRELGSFPGYAENREHMLRVIKNHRRAAYDVGRNETGKRLAGEYESLDIKPVGIDAQQFTGSDPLVSITLLNVARGVWDRAFELGVLYGYRNAQTTCIAPTGTIGLLMDCDTTGVEPDFALVKFKKLAGGGYFKIANQSVEPALKNLGYSPNQIDGILKHVLGTLTFDNAPHINRDSLMARGFTADDLKKIEDSLPAMFELGFAFSPWTLGAAFFEKIGIPESEWKAPGFNLLKKLGFRKKQIDQASAIICGTGTVEGAPGLKPEHLPVFDCANKCGKTGERFIHVEGHIRMMAASQPFISGAISKTINLPNEATLQDIDGAYRMSWELGLKANALYRDGSKLSQPLNIKSDEEIDDEESEENVQAALNEVVKDVASALTVVSDQSEIGNRQTEMSNVEAAPDHTRVIERIIERVVERPLRRRLPDTRNAITHKFDISGHEGYITVGLYEDGQPGEVFITMSKEGSTIGGLMDTIATLVSVALQYGVPVDSLVRKFEHVRFEPSGMTRSQDIPFAKSPVDYIFRWLAMEFLDGYRAANAPQRVNPKPSDSVDEDSLASLSSKNVEPETGTLENEIRAELEATRHHKKPSDRADAESSKPNSRLGSPHGKAYGTQTVANPLNQQGTQLQSDAPPCDSCGSITVRSGTCYKCLNCGNSMGCS
jgi:ribonucleoside-diphosphate reductase alpha chain